jgi:ParB family chromosome partitioning protein
VKKTLETKPQLIKISAAWNSREGAPLGRNQYVQLEIKKPKPNGASTKLPANQKACEKMTEAIVMDGGKRGQVVKVCADPACRIHHPNAPSPQQVERERAEDESASKSRNWPLPLAIVPWPRFSNAYPLR